MLTQCDRFQLSTQYLDQKLWGWKPEIQIHGETLILYPKLANDMFLGHPFLITLRYTLTYLVWIHRKMEGYSGHFFGYRDYTKYLFNRTINLSSSRLHILTWGFSTGYLDSSPSLFYKHLWFLLVGKIWYKICPTTTKHNPWQIIL